MAAISDNTAQITDRFEFWFFLHCADSSSPPPPVCPWDSQTFQLQLWAAFGGWFLGYSSKAIEQSQQNSQSLDNFSGSRSLVFWSCISTCLERYFRALTIPNSLFSFGVAHSPCDNMIHVLCHHIWPKPWTGPVSELFYFPFPSEFPGLCSSPAHEQQEGAGDVTQHWMLVYLNILPIFWVSEKFSSPLIYQSPADTTFHWKN